MQSYSYNQYLESHLKETGNLLKCCPLLFSFSCACMQPHPGFFWTHTFLFNLGCCCLFLVIYCCCQVFLEIHADSYCLFSPAMQLTSESKQLVYLIQKTKETRCCRTFLFSIVLLPLLCPGASLYHLIPHTCTQLFWFQQRLYHTQSLILLLCFALSSGRLLDTCVLDFWGDFLFCFLATANKPLRKSCHLPPKVNHVPISIYQFHLLERYLLPCTICSFGGR